MGVSGLAGCAQILGDFTTRSSQTDGGGSDGPAVDTGPMDSGPGDTGMDDGSEAGPTVYGFPDAVQVSAGEHHTCAIRAGGDVYCWGANGSGQLGVAPGAMSGSNRPIKVPTVSHATQISAGYLHTCMVDMNAAVWCWGANDSYQLGLNTATVTELPQMAMTSVLSGASQVSAGEHHTCAVGSGGDVYCWGGNGSNQITTADTTPKAMPTLVMVSSTNSAIQVSASSHHSCATLQGNTAPFLVCWGTQNVGELGNSTMGPLGPTAPSMATNFLGSSAGHDHSCGVDTNHQVWCWGGDVLGQTGSSPAGMMSSPAVVGGAGMVLEVAAGGAFTCARNNTGGVYCWGSNARAQLGVGAPPDISPHTTPAQVAMLSGVAQISTGSEHACAVLQGTTDAGVSAGAVLCWGNNAEGELGDGTTTMNRPSPSPVAKPN